MAAHIVPLARSPRVPAPEPVQLGLHQELPARFHSWCGASGRRYPHTVYSLIECPPLPRAVYQLVRRSHRCEVLHIGSGESDGLTLNLAKVRQRGAALGANEVHVHFLARTPEERRLALFDLRAAQFGTLAAEPDRVGSPHR